MLWYLQAVTGNCCVFAMKEDNTDVHLKYVHSTSELVRASMTHALANTALTGHYCPAEGGHSTVLCQKGKAAQCPTRKLPLVKEESLNGHKGCPHLYLSLVWFPGQSLEQSLGFVYCVHY